MSIVLIVILLLIVVFLAASVVLSRTTHEVGSARDTEYLELEGYWIRYRVMGGGPPVVLVHDWLSSSRIWEPLMDRLAQRFTVYTLDLSGFGDSDKPISGYGVRYGSRLLYAFCAHFGLTRTAVIGHGIGGAMAAKLAADHPDVVGRLVLVAAPANEDQMDLPILLWLATRPVIGPIVYTLGRFFEPLRELWMRPFVLDPDDLTEEVLEDAGKSTPAALSKTLSVTRREIARGRLIRQAGVIKVPILVVAGEDDQIVDPQAAEDWTQALPAEAAFLDDCGHLPMLERADEFDARVLAFLTDDSSYLAPEPLEAMEDTTVTLSPEEPSPLTQAEPEIPPSSGDTGPPTVTRKQDDRYPPRDREDAEDRPEAPPAVGRSTDRSDTDDSAERRPRNRDGGDVPEVPEGLFEWPESLKKAEPWERPHKPDRREERDENAEEPEDPEEEPRS